MHKNSLLIFLMILSVLVFSCKKKSGTINPVDYSYFPLKQKSWIVYDVTYRFIDKDVLKDSTYHYQLKEVVDTTFEDATGRINYRIERYTRQDSSQAWVISDVWSSCISDNFAEKVEENIKFVKLRFPVEKNKTWNGNVFNTMDEKDYKITSLNIPESVGSLAFDSVLTVTQENYMNAIEKYYFVEKYAKNIGLIQKQEISISKVTYASTLVPIENRISKATMYYQDAIYYGGF